MFLVPVAQIKSLFKSEKTIVSNKENKKPKEKQPENGPKKQKKPEKPSEPPKQKPPKNIESALTGVSF